MTYAGVFIGGGIAALLVNVPRPGRISANTEALVGYDDEAAPAIAKYNGSGAPSVDAMIASLHFQLLGRGTSLGAA